MSLYLPRTMLVTGGAGFIGSNFVRYILETEPDICVVNLDKLTYAGSLANLSGISKERHHFIQGDILDAKLIANLLKQYDVDTIVHFAAESHVDRSITSPTSFIETNVMGTFVLLDAARHYWSFERKNQHRHRFHHISTDEVYGSLNLTDPLFNEKTPYQPRSPYSATKASSDHLLYAYHHTYGLPITLSRCSNNYGPYQHGEKFIPTIIHSCLNWQRIPIYGDGKNIRDWLYVDDHCKGIMAIIKHGKIGESYNMGGNCEWENITLARFICERMDKLHPQQNSYTTLLEFVTDRLGHDFRYAMDTTKINTELGWSPQETLELGLMKTIKFYLCRD
jgi:dTDP-glucose 4,6-dehydratase